MPTIGELEKGAVIILLKNLWEEEIDMDGLRIEIVQVSEDFRLVECLEDYSDGKYSYRKSDRLFVKPEYEGFVREIREE